MDSKTVMITGAGRRLGLYLTEAFLIQGWRVIAFTRHNHSKEFATLKSERLRVLELGDYCFSEVDKAVSRVLDQYPKLDAVIHNASIYESDLSHEKDFSAFYERLFHIHMRVPVQINQSLRGLLDRPKKPGNIIHITDIYAENPNANYALYCSTKAGLESLSKSFAKKFAPGIRVNSIQPGPIKFLAEHTSEHKNHVLSETLLESEGGFLPIYKAIVSIIDNDYITGASIKVDGGRSLNRG